MVSNSHKKLILIYLDTKKNCIDDGNNKNNLNKEQKDNYNNKRKNINIRTSNDI